MNPESPINLIIPGWAAAEALNLMTRTQIIMAGRYLETGLPPIIIVTLMGLSLARVIIAADIELK